MEQLKFTHLQNSLDWKPLNQSHLTLVQQFIEFQHKKQKQLILKDKKENIKFEIDQKVIKKLQYLMKESCKMISKHPDHLIKIVERLISFFNDIKNPVILSLIVNVIGAQIKFQAVNKKQQNNNMVQQSIIIALPPPAEQSIIALPYSSHTQIMVYSPNDVGDQQNRSKYQQYFAQDDQKVEEYLQHPFKTVKRQGISELFQKVASLIVSQFLQKLINEQKLSNFTFQNILGILKLLEHINSPLYTYYFLSLFKQIVKQISQSFQITSQHLLSVEFRSKVKKTQYEELIYVVKTLAERWRQHKHHFNMQLWEWEMEKTMIVMFLQSQVSEKQLFSVRVLIDRIRKVQFNSYSVLNQQELILFIQTNNILGKIYRPENHPEVVIKGKQVFQFLSKTIGLNSQLIQILFQLIPKSNQNICKSLYSALQSSGHENLQKNREQIMKKITLLPRSNLFYNQTFNLIESLILLSPIQCIRQSLEYVYQIIYFHYFGLKQQLKQRVLNIYFEVYLMGIQEGYFDQNSDKIMIALNPFLQNKAQVISNLTILIIDKFVQKLKQHIPKKIGVKCKRILNGCIQILFKNYHIYCKPSIQNTSKFQQLRLNQIGLIKQLLQISDKELTKSLLEQKQLWQLIQQDSYFGRFLSYYSSESQFFILEKLLQKQSLTEKDISNIVQSYYFMNKTVKQKIFLKIKNLFETTSQFFIKQRLVYFIVKVQNLSPQNFISKFSLFLKNQFSPALLLAIFMEFKEYLTIYDRKGSGSYPAFKYLISDYQVKLKVINMVDLSNPMTFQIQEKNYKTLYDVIKRILPLIGKCLKQIKLRIDKSEKTVSLQQLKQKLNQLSPFREISILIQQSNQCEWYDQSMLINKDQQMNPQIILILKQIFNHYSEEINSQKRLFKQKACKIFQIATNTESISMNDTRILHLFNNYSQSGESLTVHQWINFYYQSALVNSSLVIDNLKNLGYGDAFNTVNEILQNIDSNSENLFRSYLSENQIVYEHIFSIFNILKQNSMCSQNQFQRIYSLALQLLKQLPIYKSFYEEMHRKYGFRPEQTKQIQMGEQQSAKFKQGEMDQQQSQFSKQKIYYASIILTTFLEKETSCVGKQKFGLNYDTTKIRQFSLDKFITFFKKLLQQSSIDPLSLKYQQQITIQILQSLGALITHNYFKGAIFFKNLLKLDVENLSPLPKKLNFNYQPVKQISSNYLPLLVSLASINNDLILNCASILLFQAQTNSNQNISQQSLKQLLSIFIYQKSILMSSNTTLSKVSNSLAYLLSESIEGLKCWFQRQILDQYRDQFIITQTFSTVDYFKSLNQTLLLELDSASLKAIKDTLIEILSQSTKRCRYAQIFESKYKNQLIEGVLLCLKTIFYNLNDEAISQQNEQTTSLVESLLTNFVLSQRSQSSLYQILSILNKRKPQLNLSFMYKKFSDLQLKKNSKLNTENQFECGIHNLGCICYINSIFQQLYHIENFCQTILSTQLKEKQADQYFIEFQKILYELKYSKRSFLITKNFCQSYKDYAGHAINIKQQHDADQFLNGLLDKLQKTYENTYNVARQKTIVRQSFKGTMSNVITCQNCFTSKVNHQQFYVLSLQIKNQASLTESLQKMIQSEVICDYYCSTCDKKVQSIHKYRKFDTLPKYLFIHFQRLVFDLQSFNKIKLDHPVNFSEQIDLQNYFYSQQTHPSKYILVGFIVHFGSSQGGHYISLIKDKNKKNWKKYNDSEISKWMWKTGLNQKENAYLLIYERKEQSQNQNLIKKETNRYNKKIIDNITQDNIALGKQITVLRADFGRFLIKQFQQCKNQAKIHEDQNFDFQNNFLKTKIIWKYLKIIDEAKSIGFSECIALKDDEIQYLGCKFIENSKSPEISEHFLDIIVEQESVKNLFQSGLKNLRQTWMAILINIIMTWDEYFSVYSYMIPSKQNQTIRKLLLHIQNGLSQVGKNYNKMDQFFQFLLIISKLNPKVREYFKEMNLVPKLIHFIMQKDSKLSKNFGFYPLNSPSGKKINCFNIIIEIIGVYLDNYPQLVQNQLVNQSLGENNFEFYRKMYQQRCENYMRLNLVLTRFSENNFEMTHKIIQLLLLNNFNRFNHDDFYIGAYLDVLFILFQLMYCQLNIKDQYREFRIFRILGIPTISCNLIEQGQTMIKKKKQKIIGYWNSFIKTGDQIIFPFLQLLYSNRNQTTYFQLIGIVFMLQLIKQNKDILNYILKLPSPCLAYYNYCSWINQFLKNSLKQNKQLQKIDLKSTLNKISQLLETVIIEQQLWNQISKKETCFTDQIALKNQITSQDEIICQNKIVSEEVKNISQINAVKLDFIDNSWLQRNSLYIFGQIVQKSEAQIICFNALNAQKQVQDENLLILPISYTILKTVHIDRLRQYVMQILGNQEVIQPNQQYQQENTRKAKFNQKLEKYLSSSKLDPFLVQLTISIPSQFSSNLKNKYSALSLKFSFPQYPYQLIIEINSVLNQQLKIIIPSPVRNFQASNTNQILNQIISTSIQIKMLNFKNKKVSKANEKQKEDIMEQQIQQKEKEKGKEKETTPDFPTVTETYGNDAYFQANENTPSNNNVNNQQVCIECPFCGYISHKFASRCPGCNQQWGLYA